MPGFTMPGSTINARINNARVDNVRVNNARIYVPRARARRITYRPHLDDYGTAHGQANGTAHGTAHGQAYGTAQGQAQGAAHGQAHGQASQVRGHQILSALSQVGPQPGQEQQRSIGCACYAVLLKDKMQHNTIITNKLGSL